MFFFFFFNDTATTEIYTLSLHDALPIYPELEDHSRGESRLSRVHLGLQIDRSGGHEVDRREDRKSTRLNSSHGYISYAVFCLKKKKKVQKLIQSYEPHLSLLSMYMPQPH